MARIRIALASVLAVAGLTSVVVTSAPSHAASAQHATASALSSPNEELCC
jgi:hypothetical protein